MKFKHYTNTINFVGNIITSEQSKNIYYEKCYNIYKKVAVSLGLKFPDFEYGYAYSSIETLRNKNFKIEIFVSTDDYLRCNNKYSLQLLVEESFFSPFSKRLDYVFDNNLEYLIEEFAIKYFNQSDIHDTNEEFISSSFEILK